MTDSQNTDFVSPDEVQYKWPRDGKGRPLVWLPDRSKQVGYTRCTTYIKCIEDKYHLQQWEKRMVAIGLAERPDLLLAVAAHRNDKAEINKLVDQAKEAARANAKSTIGTAEHKLVELHDRGENLLVPAAWQPDIEAYKKATADMRMIHIEKSCVQDDLRVGGTPDRVVAYQGGYYIADVKTGNIDFGALEFAMQFAMYARSVPYDYATGERSEWPEGLSLTKAILIHLPEGEGVCNTYWINLTAGWQAVQVAKTVRSWRNRKGLMAAIETATVANDTATAEPSQPITLSIFEGRLKRAKTVDDVRKAYREGKWAGLESAVMLPGCEKRKAEIEEKANARA